MSGKPLNRQTLKSLFKNGERPNENNFSSLIDSMVNRVDDRISKNLEDGLMLSHESNESDRMVSFYDKIQDEQPKWSIDLPLENSKGLGISEHISDTDTPARMFFKTGGDIGIGTDKPRTTLEVNGILSSSSRIGTYKLESIPANGEWHDVVTGLNGCCAFEIVAQVGKEKTGKYALLFGHALSTFGKSRSKIKVTQAHYGWWWNKLKLRWTGSTYDFSLQLKTRSDYGSGQRVNFHITKLWDNDIVSLINN